MYFSPCFTNVNYRLFLYILILYSLTLKLKPETQNMLDKLSDITQRTIAVEYHIFENCLIFELFHEYLLIMLFGVIKMYSVMVLTIT